MRLNINWFVNLCTYCVVSSLLVVDVKVRSRCRPDSSHLSVSVYMFYSVAENVAVPYIHKCLFLYEQFIKPSNFSGAKANCFACLT